MLDRNNKKVQGSKVFLHIEIEDASKRHKNPGRVKECYSWQKNILLNLF